MSAARSDAGKTRARKAGSRKAGAQKASAQKAGAQKAGATRSQARTGNGKGEAGETGAAPVPVRLAHSAPGRIRFRLAGKLDKPALGALIDRLAAGSGIARVVARPNTGSVIVEAPGNADALLRTVEATGAVKILPDAPRPPVRQMAQFGLMRLDDAIQKRTDGTLDARSTMALLLLFGAIVQLARGRIAGPATTLLMSALAMLGTGRK